MVDEWAQKEFYGRARNSSQFRDLVQNLLIIVTKLNWGIRFTCYEKVINSAQPNNLLAFIAFSIYIARTTSFKMAEYGTH